MRVFLSDDVAADVLISGFEYGMHVYSWMTSLFSLFLFLLLLFVFYIFCHLKENFQFVNEKYIYIFSILMIIHTISIK
jgi:hypothetical protein